MYKHISFKMFYFKIDDEIKEKVDYKLADDQRDNLDDKIYMKIEHNGFSIIENLKEFLNYYKILPTMKTTQVQEKQVQQIQEIKEVKEKDIKEQLYPKTKNFDFSGFDKLIEKKKNGILPLFRHGEVLIEPIESIPEGQKKLDTDIIARGSHGHNHQFRGGELYGDLEGVMYLKSDKTILYHLEHGDPDTGEQFGQKSCCIPDGTYKIYKQVEYTPEGFRRVQD